MLINDRYAVIYLWLRLFVKHIDSKYSLFITAPLLG